MVPNVLLAHGVFHGAEGVPLPGWLGNVVLIGLPLLVLCLALLLLEARTRPGAPRPPRPQGRPG